jgi:PKD repeat protein
MRSLWMGLIVLGIVFLPVLSSAGVIISPDYLYKDMPVTVSYPALSGGDQILVGFDAGFTPQTTGIQGLTASSITVPFSLNPGTITSVEGVLFNTSTQSFISDTNETVEAGTYGVRVLKAFSTTGSPVNLSWMLGGYTSGSVSAGQLTFLPSFTPKSGLLNVTARFGSVTVSKLIPYNQSIAAPAVTSNDISLITGQSGYGNVSISGLTTGLSLYNLTIGLKTGAVGNFTNVTTPSGVTLVTNSTLPASVLTVNATASMSGDLTLAKALNITYQGLVAGSSPINVTINSLKDKNGNEISPVLVTNGTYTVNSPPLPGAEFTGTPTTGIIPFNVSFLYTSPDNPNGFNWSFDDGAENASEKNPTHTYWVAGSHDVTLTVLGATDNNTKVRPDYIKARQVPVWFMGNNTSGTHPLSVSFNGSSISGMQSWVYYFGDGGVGFEQNTTHTYDVAGVYTVRAQAMIGNARNSAVRNQYITVK